MNVKTLVEAEDRKKKMEGCKDYWRKGVRGQTSTNMEEKRMTKNCKEVNKNGENGYWK